MNTDGPAGFRVGGAETHSVGLSTGKAYWRSLDERADMPAFREWMEKQFPESMRELLAGGIDRRRFLHLMAASMGLAGLSGCRRPELKALPYTTPPPGVVPGLPNFYATAMPRAGTAFPVLVESHEGRPTKIEGNPKYAASGGASDVQCRRLCSTSMTQTVPAPCSKRASRRPGRTSTPSRPITSRRLGSGKARTSMSSARTCVPRRSTCCESICKR